MDRTTDKVSFKVNPDIFGSGGIATGNFEHPSGQVMGVGQSPFWSAVNLETGAPAAGGTLGLSFLLNPGGEVMGVEPSPFHVVAVSGGVTLGFLNFDLSSGHVGSLHLEGVRLELHDGSFLDVAPLDITDTVAIYATRSLWLPFKTRVFGNVGARDSVDQSYCRSRTEVSIGPGNIVRACIHVPNGTLWIGGGSEVYGTFIGKWVVTGTGAEVTKE